METGWLVEIFGVGQPKWLTVDGSGFSWTIDSIQALRFSRKMDAEMVAGVFHILKPIVTEHQWS